MGQVVSLEEYRARRDPARDALRRLDGAVRRLDPLVRARGDRLSPTVERELRLISEAVDAGLPREAADRAERLATILEHPVASGS